MPNLDIWLVIVMGTAAAGLWAVRQFVQPANMLGLSLFRPYRGDPWPKGVQEEYDVHFDWSPRKPVPAPVDPIWSDIVVSSIAGDGDLSALADDIRFEDLDGETAAVSPVHGDVRIAPH